jgi:hypothetical protein
VWAPEVEQEAGAGGWKRWMPAHVPDVVPHWPGVAAAGLRVAIVFDQPSVHHGFPPAPMVTRWPRSRTAGRRCRLCGAREVEQVRVFWVVELQRASQRLEHAVRDAAQVPSLESCVVVNADPRQQREPPPAAVPELAGYRRRPGVPPAEA